jgi:polyhydroxyalkanoate synthesis repressor PhaR
MEELDGRGRHQVETHVVKRYSNRKLYDTYSRRYVTLDGIAQLLREGHEVRVVDRRTGDDITAVTLSRILLDMEQQHRGPIPETVLVDLVKERGEQIIGLLRTSLALPREIRQRAAGSLEQRVDDVLSSGLRGLNIATREDLAALEAKVDALAAKVDALLASANSRARRGARARRESER